MRDHALVELDYDRLPEHWRSLVTPDLTEFQKFGKLLFLLSLDEHFDFFVFRSGEATS